MSFYAWLQSASGLAWAIGMTTFLLCYIAYVSINAPDRAALTSTQIHGLKRVRRFRLTVGLWLVLIAWSLIITVRLS